MQSRVIPGPFTGKQIIDAMKMVAGTNYQEHPTKGPGVIVGQISRYYFNDMIVNADGITEVVADKTYENICLQEHDWSAGAQFTMVYRRSRVEAALKNFADSLEAELKSQPA